VPDPPPRPTPGRKQKVGGDGTPEVFVADEQSDVAVDLPRWQQLAFDVLIDEGVRGLSELAVIFVAEDEIAELNAEHMGVTGPTDVLAFPIDGAEAELVQTGQPISRGPDRSPPDPADMPLLLGDVVVCPAVAARQAATHAGTLDDELALLVVHGVLHVLGHDHADDAQAAAMRQRELELLSAHHWHGPAPDGFRQEQEQVP
jgi:probable rRNA maturation factor